MGTPINPVGVADRLSPSTLAADDGRVLGPQALADDLSSSTAEARRAFPRIPCRVLVDYVVDGRAYRDCIANISEGGAFVETSRPLEAGRPITLSFALFQDQQPIKVVGEVAWAGATGVGVRFHQNPTIGQFCAQEELSPVLPRESETPRQQAVSAWGRRVTDLPSRRRSANPYTALPVWAAVAVVTVLVLISRYDTNARILALAEKVDRSSQAWTRIESVIASRLGQVNVPIPVEVTAESALPGARLSSAGAPAAIEQRASQPDVPAANPDRAAAFATSPESKPIAAPPASAPVTAAAKPVTEADGVAVTNPIVAFTKQPSTTEPAPETIYVVHEGDNLFRIGLKFNIPPQTLMAHNKLTRADAIFVGQRIRIPLGENR